MSDLEHAAVLFATLLIGIGLGRSSMWRQLLLEAVEDES